MCLVAHNYVFKHELVRITILHNIAARHGLVSLWRSEEWDVKDWEGLVQNGDGGFWAIRL